MPAPLELRIPIRWRDMDGFRHVNNAVYLTYLEAARDAFVGRQAPASLDRFVVRRVEIDYLASLAQDDGEAIVTCTLDGVGTTSVRLVETIAAASDGRIAAEARAVLVHMDEARERALPIPDDVRAQLEA